MSKKIGLIDVDSNNFPNLALMKISSFHKQKGDNVEWLNYLNNYNIAYVSKIFDFTKSDNTFINTDHVFKGGTGFNLTEKLPQRIENADPDYSIYPNFDYSIQLFSRGCIRKCKFCVVNKKEGNIYPVKPMELNPKGKHIEILDNNFFANPEWKSAIDLLIKWNQKVNFHGVDIRIMNEEQAFYLNKLKHKKQIHIAWDHPEMNLVYKLKEMIKYIKPYKIMCYVLIGFNSTPEQDMHRIQVLKGLGISPFVMPFDKKNKYQKRLARWVNHKAVFNSVSFEDYKY